GGNLYDWIGGDTGAGAPAYAGTEPDHDHDYSSAQDRTPQYRQTKLIKKITSPGDVPSGAMVMADGALIRDSLAEVSSYLGRLHRAGSSVSTGGATSAYTVNPTVTAEPDHDHQSSTGLGTSYSSAWGPAAFKYKKSGGHGHSLQLSVSLNHRYRNMAFYLATVDTEIIPGAVIGFDPAESVPAGWYECDGDNGTVDLRGHYIRRSSSTDAGDSAGDNTASWTGT